MLKPKTININGTQFAQSSEFKASHSTLERLVETNKTKKVSFGGVNYYHIAATNNALETVRTVPDGYVKASDYGVERGHSPQEMRKLCGTRGAPAVQRVVGAGRPAWYADKTWLDKKIGIQVVEAKKPVARVVKTKSTPTVDLAAKLTSLVERAEALVTRLESVLGTDKPAREANRLDVSITPYSNGQSS